MAFIFATAAQAASREAAVDQTADEEYADIFGDLEEEEGEAASAQAADPLYHWNKAVFHFNDRLYFWVLKPVASGYKAVTPSLLREGVRNFFRNLTTPVRFLNCLLQGKSEAAGVELGRFMVNTTVGVLGFGNPAKYQSKLNIKQDPEDFGQTLGTYGVGNGFYIVWPVLGPSTLRDTVGMVSDGFVEPLNYVEPTAASVGIRVYDNINGISFRLGDYERLKEASLEPYEAFRNAYIQNRRQRVADKTVGR